jgi:hypothetical protein
MMKKVVKMTKNERILEEVAELISKKETKREQDAFLQQMLFGMK